MALSSKIDLQEPIQYFNVEIAGLKYDTPCIFLRANKPNVDKVVFFIHGLNGTKNSLQFLHHHLENAHIIGYDERSCGDNKNPATNHYWQYALDLKNLITELKDEFVKLNIKEIYLMGESFGAAISILFYKRFQDLINGVVLWNMPRKVIDISDSSKKEKFLMAGPMLYSWITNLPTFKSAPSPVNKLSNNRSLILATKMKMPNILSDNRSIIAAWWGNKKAWKILLSEKFFKNAKKDIFYISSKQDPLIDTKAVHRLDTMLKNSDTDKIVHFELPKGTHILLYDQYLGAFLLDAIDHFVLLDKKNNLNNFKSDVEIIAEKYLAEK